MSNNQAQHDTIAYELHGNCYLNITNRCTLRCAFCPKFNKTWEVQGYPLRLKTEPSVDDVLQAIGDPSRYKQVVFCGLGESTLRLDVMLTIAEKLKASHTQVRVNTDGLANLVHQRDVTPEFAGRIDALSISLNAQNEETYNRHTRPPLPGAFKSVLDFVKCAQQHVADITLTAIDGLDGVDIHACNKIADELAVKFRRRVLDEVG